MDADGSRVVEVAERRRGGFVSDHRPDEDALPDPSVLAEENEALEAALIVAKASELCDSDRSSLFLVDHEHQELWSRVAEGLGGANDDGSAGVIRLPLGGGIAGFVAQTGVALNLPDAYKDPRFNQDWDKQTGYRTQSLLCVPILDGDGQVMGVLQSLNKSSGSFTIEDERLLEAVGHQISVALTNALLFLEIKQKATSLEQARGELQRRVSELDLLGSIERAMGDAASVDELLNVVTQQMAALVNADAASIATVDRSSGGLQFRAASGEAAADVLKHTLPPDRGLIGAALRDLKSVSSEHAGEDPRHDKDLASDIGFAVGPALAVPLLAEGRAVGALEVLRQEGAAAFSDDDQRILELLGVRVAAALDGARRRERSAREEQLQTIGTMLSGIVHDFKTPMTVIAGYVQLMSETEDAAERQECADIVLKQTDMMTAMTKELLQFARGDTEILIRKVYLQSFARELGDMLGQLFKDTRIDVDMDIRYRGAARFDEIKLKRAVANLAKNAREAMDDAGKLHVVIDQVGDQVEIAVADTGPGLPPEMENRLFESFATHGKAEGTGLGLALVKKIMDDHQGEVRVENEAGEGVTFRLRLPL
jgi:signal transduction histidine kinase